MTATTKPPANLSPIAHCLRIAAQRGRALRLQREAQQQQAAEPTRRDDDQVQPNEAQPAPEAHA